MQDSGDLYPDGPPSPELLAQELKGSPMYRESIQEAVRRSDFNGIRESMYNKVWYLSMRYCKYGYPMEIFETTIHDFWYCCYHGGRYLSHESAEHDRLVLDIVRFRARGALKRPRKQNHQEIEIAKTPTGVVWEDLPFLVSDMTDYWLNDCATMTASQRCNFARFLAKLASAGLCNDGLFQIALLVFRDALETARPLGSFNDPGDANPDRRMQDLTVADLLPAVYAWIQEAQYKIIWLSAESWNNCSGDTGRGGATFVESELGKKSPSGFSHWRWMFWLKRLEDINQEAKQAGEKLMAQQISLMLNNMTNGLEQRDPLTFKRFEAAEELIPDKKEFSIKYLIERWNIEWWQNQEEDGKETEENA
ncbi:hypothetical protein Asppvi_008434 [Aspergillus pseudoviridinutans]|uniref:Uncharacterized protein n=1 Tax=Aspergillus pseudoviridinutans TaxID=1517512 RepID=A0A9P3BDN9_9EURO|nr:uncharacterized protein Asppvi_008434 [Aspergillus pseudoviridinutans]GIJ89492.1 hypothetical protein Asppvi_008434 [Aspergillus pseudoviridinutans]